MKLTEILFTLERLETRERNVVTDKRTVKFAANHNAEVLKRVREIIDYSATAELLGPPVVNYEVASTPSCRGNVLPVTNCDCDRCRNLRCDRPEAGIVLGPQPTPEPHVVVEYLGTSVRMCSCGQADCPRAS